MNALKCLYQSTLNKNCQMYIFFNWLVGSCEHMLNVMFPIDVFFLQDCECYGLLWSIFEHRESEREYIWKFRYPSCRGNTCCSPSYLGSSLLWSKTCSVFCYVVWRLILFSYCLCSTR